MQGKILDYNNEFKSGLIRGEDGNKYRFSIDDCKSELKPRPNAEVDFEPDGDKAVEIYVMTKDTVDDIKDVAFKAKQATVEIAKTGINKSKKLIPYIISLLVLGGIAILIAVIVEENDRREYHEQMAQERAKEVEATNRLKNDYNHLVSKCNDAIKQRDCKSAEKALTDAKNLINSQDVLQDSKQWKYDYKLAECYILNKKPLKALSLLDNPIPYDGDPNFTTNLLFRSNFGNKSEDYRLKHILTSKAFRIKGDSRSAHKYAQLACEAGDCSLVEK
mgnify:CR=1 FL=1